MGVRRRRGRGFPIAACLIGSSIFIAGCGGGSANGDAQLLALRHAASVTSATGLRMNIQLHETVGGPSVVLHATGSFIPARQTGSMTMDMQAPSAGGGGPTAMPVVIANGTIYERLPTQLASRIPGGRPWLSLKLSRLSALDQMPGLFPFIKQSLTFGDPSQYLDFLSAASAGSVTKLGEATVNGVRTTRYQTAVDLSKLPRARQAAGRQAAAQLALVLRSRLHNNTMRVNVWVDHSNLIRRLQTNVGGSFSGHAVAIAVTENITRYGSQPIPTAPSAGETTSLLSLVQAFNPGSGQG